MRSEFCDSQTVYELAIRGLKEEHAACVARIGQVAANPDHRQEVEGYLLRIENINQALVRLAASRVVH